jgi:hypothetical protein
MNEERNIVLRFKPYSLLASLITRTINKVAFEVVAKFLYAQRLSIVRRWDVVVIFHPFYKAFDDFSISLRRTCTLKFAAEMSSVPTVFIQLKLNLDEFSHRINNLKFKCVVFEPIL